TTTPSIKGCGSLTRLLDPIAPMVAALLCATASSGLAEPGQDNRAPAVPATLEVPDGNKVSFHGHAEGVQIYVSTPSATDATRFVWTFRAPEAVLFDNDGNVVAIHYAGPTWESESGSKVVGARVAGVTVDSTAIPWLLLSAVTARTEGPGIFARTTYVQRVNTTGGLAPAAAPTEAGLEARVPYTADYYFFRESHH
ncbi:MAG TPA: DUF3455 domain-containing protein, partial [Verrucomicrobiae bacterium]|nr:DUF3455 domain-containing protein [Verrucomicrobiae bacterium]